MSSTPYTDIHHQSCQAQPQTLHSRLRITVYDVLESLASGMTHEQILTAFPYLTKEDIQACLAFAADRERKLEIRPH